MSHEELTELMNILRVVVDAIDRLKRGSSAAEQTNGLINFEELRFSKRQRIKTAAQACRAVIIVLRGGSTPDDMSFNIAAIDMLTAFASLDTRIATASSPRSWMRAS